MADLNYTYACVLLGGPHSGYKFDLPIEWIDKTLRVVDLPDGSRSIMATAGGPEPFVTYTSPVGPNGDRVSTSDSLLVFYVDDHPLRSHEQRRYVNIHGPRQNMQPNVEVLGGFLDRSRLRTLLFLTIGSEVNASLTVVNELMTLSVSTPWGTKTYYEDSGYRSRDGLTLMYLIPEFPLTRDITHSSIPSITVLPPISGHLPPLTQEDIDEYENLMNETPIDEPPPPIEEPPLVPGHLPPPTQEDIQAYENHIAATWPSAADQPPLRFRPLGPPVGRTGRIVRADFS